MIMKSKNRKQSLDIQLAAYSVIAVGVMANPLASDAQVLYTDLYEDVQKTDTAEYIFDINEDKFHDLRVFSGFHDNGQFVNMQLGDSVEVLGNTYGYYFYPFALDQGASIDGNNPNWHDRDYGTMNWQSNNDYGNWIGVEDKYVGIKIILNGNSYFGWARLDVDVDAKKFIVKDYAFEFRSGHAIICGEALTTYGISELTAVDVADQGDPSDMQISFRKAIDETKVNEYRIILVKTTDTIQLSPALAMTLSSDYYTTVAKTGNDIMTTLPTNAKDKNGDLIKNGVYYKAYVLSVPDGVNATEPILSTNQKYVVLHVPSSEAGKPTALDISDHNNGSDVQVNFAMASDESKVSQYRIFVIKTEKVNSFTIDVAKACGPAKFINVDKTGSDIEKVLDASLKDTDGDLIKDNTNYHVYIMSIADGVFASKNVLSEPSDQFKLSSKVSILADKYNAFNPYNSDNKLVLSTDFLIPSGSQLQVFSVDGQLQLERKEISSNEEIPHSLSNGVYIMLLLTPDNQYYKKIVISN